MLPDDPSTASASGFHALFQNRPFMMLWSGQILSQIADKVFLILLISLAAQPEYQQGLPDWLANSQAMQNSESPRALLNAIVMVANTLPAVLFGSAAGICVDRFDKRKIMWVSNVSRGILTIALLLLPKLFLVLLFVAFLESILTQFFAPAEQAAIPLLVPHEGLMSANALFTTTMTGSLTVGFAIGDPVLSLAKSIGGDYGEVLTVGLLYIAAGVVFCLIPMTDKITYSGVVDLNPWNDFKAGLKYIRRDRLVSNAMLQITLLYSVFAALTVLASDMAAEIGFANPERQFSYLLSSAGVGMVLGAGVLGTWGDRFHHKPLPLIGFLTQALVLGVFTYANRLWLGLTLSVFLGLGAAFVAVPMQTLIQRKTPESMRGKVFGFQNNIVNIALSIPLAIAGVLTNLFGLQFVLVGMSIVVSIVGFWAWFNTRKVLRDAI
jgi:MFS family permease